MGRWKEDHIANLDMEGSQILAVTLAGSLERNHCLLPVHVDMKLLRLTNYPGGGSFSGFSSQFLGTGQGRTPCE